MARTVTYTPRTVAVHLDRLEEIEGQHRFFESQKRDDGKRPNFADVPVAALWLHGSIEWPANESLPGLDGEAVPIRVHVNGYEQVEAVLERYDKTQADRRRRFRARILLTRKSATASACSCRRA